MFWANKEKKDTKGKKMNRMVGGDIFIVQL